MKVLQVDKEGIIEYAPYQVLEGADVNFRISFKVHFNTVMQLSFTGDMTTKLKKLGEWDEPLGNYAPLDKVQSKDF